MGKKREVCCSRVSSVTEGGFPPSLGPFEQPQMAAIATKRWRARSMSTEASQPCSSPPQITGEDAGRPCEITVAFRQGRHAIAVGLGNVQAATCRPCCPGGGGASSADTMSRQACYRCEKDPTPRARNRGLRRDLDQQGFARGSRSLDR